MPSSTTLSAARSSTTSPTPPESPAHSMSAVGLASKGDPPEPTRKVEAIGELALIGAESGTQFAVTRSGRPVIVHASVCRYLTEQILKACIVENQIRHVGAPGILRTNPASRPRGRGGHPEKPTPRRCGTRILSRSESGSPPGRAFPAAGAHGCPRFASRCPGRIPTRARADRCASGRGLSWRPAR